MDGWNRIWFPEEGDAIRRKGNKAHNVIAYCLSVCLSWGIKTSRAVELEVLTDTNRFRFSADSAPSALDVDVVLDDERGGRGKLLGTETDTEPNL